MRERGEILKIETLVKDYEGGVLIKFKEYAGSNVFKLKEIEKWKHSQNIIDLIEVGDYVNGELVASVSEESVEIGEGWHVKAKDIKSIVTHQQFNSIKYEVI